MAGAPTLAHKETQAPPSPWRVEEKPEINCTYTEKDRGNLVHYKYIRRAAQMRSVGQLWRLPATSTKDNVYLLTNMTHFN